MADNLDSEKNNHPPALDGLAQAAADEDGGDSKLPALDNIGEHNVDEQETYVYRDFSTLPAPENMTGPDGAVLHPQSLQAQKLPAKLASMLCDHDLTAVITWLPHGRSWKVLNRDLFADHALPRYFGHKNYASFVRIANAWGMRRITRGADRDSYYHELFLRGRPDLHQRMKRLGTLHRKTPVHKEDKIPDFYELSKTSPLPEITYHRGGAVAEGPSAQPAFTHPAMNHVYPQAIPTGHLGGPNSQFSPIRQVGGGVASLPPPVAATGGLSNDQLIGLLRNDTNPEAARLAQLQVENEDLKRRIAAMEAANGSLVAPPQPPSSETLERMKREIMLQQLGAASGSDEALLRALKAENDAKAQATGDEETKRQALIAALSPQQQQQL